MLFKIVDKDKYWKMNEVKKEFKKIGNFYCL